jgi:AraC-like DNA-binding protein/ligand-binding sensor protein
MNASHPNPAPTELPHDRREDVVTRLQQSQLFRDYQDAFQTATGLPLVLRPVGSFQPPLYGSKKIASFCAVMGGTSKSCAACLQLQAKVEADSVTEPKTLQCFAGLSESVVPVRLGERVIGYLQTGQVLLRPATEKSFRTAMAELERWKMTVNLEQLHAAYFETRVLTTKRYSAVLRLLSSFAHHLSLVSNELMIKQASAEPPAVAKARAFITENLGESLSLEQVAHAASMSPFYFCKVFKLATGLTFTDYVARARVEQTKHLLLNPQVRVSEAAYEAGFQSLSQFNRVFRRVEGQAPSTYREHLHGAEPAAKSRSGSTYAFAA